MAGSDLSLDPVAYSEVYGLLLVTKQPLKIALLDTSIGATNTGNRIIVQAVTTSLRSLFRGAFFYHFPALDYVLARRHLLQECDFVFLAGTNVLSRDMNKTSEWRVGLTALRWVRNVILCGVGWWQYQVGDLNLYTRMLMRRVLDRRYAHSVRDSYTAAKVTALGVKNINTGCPTLWHLTPGHCAGIPRTKSASVILTFTHYSAQVQEDRLLFDTVRRRYRNVYFWPQGFEDCAYGLLISENGFDRVIEPDLESFDRTLDAGSVDYVGTRLHAGVRALQKGRRAIIVAVDNRAIEMGTDVNLPIVRRNAIHNQLGSAIDSTWPTDVRINQAAIELWERQFVQLRQEGICNEL